MLSRERDRKAFRQAWERGCWLVDLAALLTPDDEVREDKLRERQRVRANKARAALRDLLDISEATINGHTIKSRSIRPWVTFAPK